MTRARELLLAPEIGAAKIPQRTALRWLKCGLIPSDRAPVQPGKKNLRAAYLVNIAADDFAARVLRVSRLLRAGFTFDEVKTAMPELEERLAKRWKSAVVIAQGDWKTKEKRQVKVVPVKQMQKVIKEAGRHGQPLLMVNFREQE